MAVRSIRRRPAFTLVIVATLALGMGPALAVFGMVDQLLMRPLPGVPNTSSAAYLVFGEPGRGGGLTRPDFDELRRNATLVDGIAVYGLMSLVATPEQGRPISIYAQGIYGDFFEILGATASEGRVLSAEDTDLDANPLVAVIGESLRDRAFGAGAAAVGRTLTVNGHPVEIVGVAAAGFAGAERQPPTEAWLPHGALVPLLGFQADRMRGRESSVGRDLIVGLREDVAMEAIEAQVSHVLAGIVATTPEAAESIPEGAPRVFEGLSTSPLERDLTHRTLRAMTWAVALLLAIACANVANLLLFRNLARRGALATQRALGASPGRLARNQLIESLLFGLLGSATGLGVAWLIKLPFRGEQLARTPAFEGFTVGWSTAAFASGAAMLTAVLFGMVPAALAGRFDLNASLRASRTHDSGRLGLLRAALSTGQISLTLALLVGALLMVRTIANLRAVDTGLDIEGVAWTVVPDRRPGGTTDVDHARQRELIAALSGVEGVEGVALDLFGPHGSRNVAPIGLPGVPLDVDVPLNQLTTQWPVTPGWFDVFRMAPIAGRTFREDDWTFPAGNEVVLTASLARRLFGQVDVVGRTVVVGRNTTEHQVIGVVGDYRSMNAPEEPSDAFFVPSLTRSDFSVMTRVRSGDGAAVARVREVIESFYPELPIPESEFLAERVERIRTEERLLGYLLWTLSAFGVLISAVGLYGVIYFIVSSRQKELGIRRALGADGIRIVRLVTRTAAVIVLSGAVLGSLVAYALSGALQSELFGVEALDPISYAGAAILVVLAAFVAGLTPARAALAVDPVAVLKDE
jgi:predicted permease